jgi:hypothetical protein
MGVFGAPYDCALRDVRRLHETFLHNGANEQATKTRAIRGQRRQWLCICGCQNASNTVSWPLLPMESLSRAVSAWSWSSVKKRASFSSQPSAPLSSPMLAM